MIYDGVYVGKGGGVNVFLDDEQVAHFPCMMEKWGGILVTGGMLAANSYKELILANAGEMVNNEEKEKLQQQTKYDELAATVADMFPPTWKRIFDVCINTGFSEEQAFVLVQTWIIANSGGPSCPPRV